LYVGSQPSVDVASSGTYPAGTLSRVPLPSDMKVFHSSHPVQSQQSETHPMYATPAAYASSSVHARNAEPAYSQSKTVATPSSVGVSGQPAGLLRQPSQTSYEQNGQMNAAGDQRQVFL